MSRLSSFFISAFMLVAMATCHGGCTAAASSALVYKVREATQPAQHTPLVVLLHGLGSNEDDLLSLEPGLPSHALVVSVRAPFGWGDGYAWYAVSTKDGKRVANTEQLQSSLALLVELLDELAAKYAYDKEQVYFMGFSQGAIMSYAMALQHPTRVHGIAAWSGRIDASCLTNRASEKEIQQVHFFISHGTADGMIGIDEARKANEELLKIGVKPEYHEYPAAHTITPEMAADTYKWLESLVNEHR